MVGLDQFITKNATLTNEKCEDAHPIKAMKFSVSPVVSNVSYTAGTLMLYSIGYSAAGHC